jgi:hypothetical protein
MAKQTEIDAGVTALVSYEGWEANFFPEGANAGIATTVIDGADKGLDQSPAGRQTAGERALRAAAVATGHSDQLSDDMCRGATSAVLAAVAALRKK